MCVRDINSIKRQLSPEMTQTQKPTNKKKKIIIINVECL